MATTVLFFNGFTWALFSAVFAALTAIFAKIGLAGADSDLAALIRALSGLATGASWVRCFRALKIGDASKVTAVDRLVVLLVMVFAVTFLGERSSPREWIGILMVGAGVFVLALKK